MIGLCVYIEKKIKNTIFKKEQPEKIQA